MTNVQLENGYIQIANEVLEHLASIKFDGTEFRLIFFLLRKTWGWKKKEDKI